MPRSFLIKKNNYSNCPLKKRPLKLTKELMEEYDKDQADNSEPENLSTKPEDLSLSTNQHYPHKSVTPPLAVALISTSKRTPLSDNPASALNHQNGVMSPPHFLVKSSGGPLEPLNLNTPAEHPHYASPQAMWPRTVPPQYSPHYLPFNYSYPPPPELYGAHHSYTSPVYPLSPARSPMEQQASPYSPCDSSASSPPHSYSNLPHRQPVPADSSKFYMSYMQVVDYCGLSPTSSVASSYTVFQSSSPPPATPEDLSSPGSVSSGSSSSAGSTGVGKRRSKDSASPRYQCPDCSKSYSTYSGLSKHQQFHCAATAGAQAKKCFSCKYCEKVYISLGALKMHIRTHTLPCKCRLCGKAFSRPWLLQGHIRTHTGEKPFSCQHCNRAFADRSNLRAHLQTHSDVKKYSCTSCSKTFSRMSLLSKHMDGGCTGVSTHLGHLSAQREGIVEDVKVGILPGQREGIVEDVKVGILPLQRESIVEDVKGSHLPMQRESIVEDVKVGILPLQREHC